jgi:hypothetical protein
MASEIPKLDAVIKRPKVNDINGYINGILPVIADLVTAD